MFKNTQQTHVRKAPFNRTSAVRNINKCHLLHDGSRFAEMRLIKWLAQERQCGYRVSRTVFATLTDCFLFYGIFNSGLHKAINSFSHFTSTISLLVRDILRSDNNEGPYASSSTCKRFELNYWIYYNKQSTEKLHNAQMLLL